MNLKELITKAKGIFDAAPAAPIAPVAPADTSNATVYTLQDGSQIAIQQAGDTPAPGDMVTVAGAPAPEGILTLQDGSMITCDATGAITLYTPVGGAPVTTDVPGADGKQTPPPATPAAPAPTKPAVPAAPPKPGGYTEQDKAALLASFDTATGDDLVNNLIICVKALMQSEFGWQILEQQRLMDTNAAINVYKTSLALSSQKQTDLEKIVNEQKALIEKHQATIAGMFEILEKVVELPTASPKTVSSAKKDEFEDKRKKNEDKFQKIADNLKKVKANA